MCFHVLWTKTTVVYVTSSYDILYLHTSTPFCQQGKQCTTTVGNNRYKLSVCEVVGSSKRYRWRQEITTQDEKIVEKRSFEQ